MEYREKMSREMRAKQFMPFAALKGYEEALRSRERVPVSRKEFFEDYQEELDRKLKQIRRGDTVRVTYYEAEEYRKIYGEISDIDPAAGTVKIDDKEIPAENIWDFEKLP